MKPNRNRARDLGFYVLLIVIMMAVIFTMTGEKDTNKIKNYSDLVDLFTEEKVQSFRTEGSTIILEVRTGDAVAPTEEMKYDLYSFGVFYEDFKDIIQNQYASGVLEEYDYDEGFVAPWWASMIPYVLVMVGVMALWYVMMNKAGGGAGGIAKFSKARTRLGSDEKNKKTFSSSQPATSAKVFLFFSSAPRRVRALLNLAMPLVMSPPPALFMMKYHAAMETTIIST